MDARRTSARCPAAAWMTLLRRLQQRRGAGAELLEKRGLVRLGGGEMAHLDVPEASDLFRNRGESDRDGVIVRRELGQNLVEHRRVVGNQFAFGLTLRRMAKNIEGGAAQALEAREQSKGRQHPGTEHDLARAP